MDLDGKAAIITGGGTGVGRATALALARRGCSTLIDYSRSREAAEQTAAEASSHGVGAVAFQGDVADDAACVAMVEAAMAQFGRLDVLVNNAAVTSFLPHAELDKVGEEDWNRILAVNLRGPFQCARAAAKAMEKTGGGDVVNVSSVAGITGAGSSIPYCASKAALNNLTVALARALAPRIRVNAVAPGFITGRWWGDQLGEAYDAVQKAMEQRSPLGKVCEPEDVAETILSLIAGSDLVTGAVLPVGFLVS
jgi:3-oxoacyl-[acyl-carrier protein] reductase